MTLSRGVRRFGLGWVRQAYSVDSRGGQLGDKNERSAIRSERLWGGEQLRALTDPKAP